MHLPWIAVIVGAAMTVFAAIINGTAQDDPVIFEAVVLLNRFG